MLSKNETAKFRGIDAVAGPAAHGSVNGVSGLENSATRSLEHVYRGAKVARSFGSSRNYFRQI